MSLDTELVKLISSRLGIWGPNEFGKLMSLTSQEFRGGLVKGESIYFILLPRFYQTHTDCFLSVRCDNKNYYLGFAALKEDLLLENILFCEKSGDRFVPCNTAMKLTLSLFIEMFSGLNIPPEFVAGQDASLYEFEKFYIASYPEDI